MEGTGRQRIMGNQKDIILCPFYLLLNILNWFNVELNTGLAWHTELYNVMQQLYWDKWEQLQVKSSWSCITPSGDFRESSLSHGNSDTI